MKRLLVQYAANPAAPLTVGELAENRGRYFFEFSSDFRIKGFPLSPRHHECRRVLACQCPRAGHVAGVPLRVSNLAQRCC